MVPARYDFYSQKRVRIWLMLDVRDDLHLTTADPGDSIGEPPDWYDYEVGGVGWNTILDLGWARGEVREEILWMLAKGIAPGQPFLVDLPEPRYYRCGEYGSETDVEYDWSIEQIAPWPAWRSARAWQRLLKAEGITIPLL